jgi:hypothetical protein
MIYTDKFAFIHIPKTSGMSIKVSIKSNCPDAKYMPVDPFSEESTDWIQLMQMHNPYSHWESLVEDRWVFSVVRNPFVRAVSFYVFLKTIYDFKDNLPDLTFEELYTKKDNNFHIPTTTQTEFLTGTKGIVPNIFKYEDGYAEIEDKLGFKISHKMNVTPSYNYLDYYDESREKLILNLFEEDFENFNYSTSLPI